MDKIHSDGKESGARIVEAIEAVDCILAKRGYQNRATDRFGSGCQLRRVNANYKLRRQDVSEGDEHGSEQVLGRTQEIWGAGVPDGKRTYDFEACWP